MCVCVCVFKIPFNPPMEYETGGGRENGYHTKRRLKFCESHWHTILKDHSPLLQVKMLTTLFS